MDSLPAEHCQYKITEIHGYADTKRNEDYNINLSRRRALSMQKYLYEQGFPSLSAKIFAHGEKDLMIPTNDEVELDLNRYVSVVIVDQDLGNTP